MPYGEKGVKRFNSERDAKKFEIELKKNGYWYMGQTIVDDTMHNIIGFAVAWAREKDSKDIKMIDGHCKINGEFVNIYQE